MDKANIIIDEIVLAKSITTIYRGWVTEIKRTKSDPKGELLVKIQVFEKESLSSKTPLKMKTIEEKTVPFSNVEKIKDFTFDQLSKKEQIEFALFFGDGYWFETLMQ